MDASRFYALLSAVVNRVKSVRAKSGYAVLLPLSGLLLAAALLWLLSALPSAAQEPAAGPAAQRAPQAVYYVTPGGAGAVCSTDTPCALATAVDLAVAGDTIRVAAGTYEGSGSGPVLAISTTVTLEGGYDPADWSRDPLLNRTILDGEEERRVVYVGGGAPTIDGFFIQKGFADFGAGIFSEGAPTIRNNWIRRNQALSGIGQGGGLYLLGPATVERNRIYQNRALEAGGAIHAGSVTGTVEIRLNQVYSNTTLDGGSIGGAIVAAQGAFLLEGNTFFANSSGRGGALATADSTPSLTFLSNLFYENEAATYGGALYLLGESHLWNDTLADNSAGTNGGAIYLGSSAGISNTILAYNSSGGSWDGIFVEFATDSAQGSNNNVYQNANGGPDAANQILFTDTITDAPAFINRAGDVYHLTAGSPNVDAGIASPATVDIDEQARPNSDTGVFDVGADEYYADVLFSYRPEFSSYFVERGGTAVVTHTLRNEGPLSAAFTFACSNSLWAVTACPGALTLDPGQVAQTTVSVDVPAGADPYDIGTTVITATASGDSARVATDLIVAPIPGISFTPSYSDAVQAGETLTFTHYLTNGGDYEDDFRVTIVEDERGWAELVAGEVVTITDVAPGETREVAVAFHVPQYAPVGLASTAVIEASSVFSPAVAATVSDTVTARATTGTRYVSPTGNDADNNCTTPVLDDGGQGGPCLTIAHALDQAAFGDEVQIAAGTYAEWDLSINSTIYVEGGWNSSFSEQGEKTATVIDGGGNGRLLTIAPGSAVEPTINNLTMEGGDSAGAGGALLIGSNARVRLSNLLFRNNTAADGGALYLRDNADVTVRASEFMTNSARDDGGALFNNSGILAVRESAFLTNTAAADGGALYNQGGDLTLRQSRFEANSAETGGGAFYNDGGLVQASNNLFHANEAGGSGGGWYTAGGQGTSTHNTLVANTAGGDGGGFYNAGSTLAIVNTIVASNTIPAANTGAAVYASGGSTSVEAILLWANDPGANDLVGITANNGVLRGDPLFVDELFHLPASADSAAVDTGAEVNLDVDFEGDFRPSDQGYDIGWDELAGCRARRDGLIYGSIQDAVDVADAESDLIQVTGICRGVGEVSVGGVPIFQTVFLDESLTIQGGWNGDFSQRTYEPTYVDPEGAGRGFYISGAITGTIETITVRNGDAGGLGGGPNGADAGGAIYNEESDITLLAVSLFSSTAELGGGFYNDLGAPLLLGEYTENPDNPQRPLRVAHNTATVDGGGIYNYGGELFVDSAYVYDNGAGNRGGGIFNQQGDGTYYNVVLYGNSAANGGAIATANSGAPDFWHLTVYSNTASNSGGGLYNANAFPTIYNTIFHSNQAASGTAIFSDSGTPVVDYNYYYPYTANSVTTIAPGANAILAETTPPGLIDPEGGDFHLADDAPAADEGSPTAPVDHDFDGHPRPTNQGFDIGADEIEGCYARVGDVIYGSIQAAIAAAEGDATIQVAGRCSGVHPVDTTEFGDGAACGTTISTTVHITKNVTLQGGWNTNFSGRNDVTILDALGEGHVIYVAPGSIATIEGFDILNGAAAKGGGICVDNASPEILDNQFYSNTATSGGALYAYGASSARTGRNDFFNNSATDGAAIYLETAGQASTVENNFIYRNEAAGAGGGFYNASGSNRFWHNTVVSNTATTGGALYVGGGAPVLRNNIVVNNQATTTGGIHVAAGSPDRDYNDVFNNAGGDFGGTIGGPGPNSIQEDPDFALPAADDYTIEFASPVVDAGDPSLPVFVDFEDDIRPSHQGYDMGADEVGGCYAQIAGDPGAVLYGSVQRAVDEAEPGATVQFSGECKGVNERTVGGSSAFQGLFITKTLTLDGAGNLEGAGPGILNALGRGRVIYVGAGTAFTLTNSTLVQGNANAAGYGDGYGGGIYSEGTLVVEDTRLQGNRGTGGGAIYNGGTLSLARTEMMTNTASATGGGLYNAGGIADTTTVVDSLFQGNTAAQGGALYQESGSLLVDGNILRANSAGQGGVFYLGGTDEVAIWNNFVYENQAADGAGVYANGPAAMVHFNTFVRNNATNDGGGIYVRSGSPDVQFNIVHDNEGSGVYVEPGVTGLTLDYNNVVGNDPINYGGQATAGPNSISATPQYVDPFEDDYHLQSDSPGVDIEIPDDYELMVDYDYDDHIRPTNGGPDIGADEINSCLIRVGNQIFGVLQSAIDYAEGNPDYDTLEIAQGECKGVKPHPQTTIPQVGYISGTLHITGSLNRSDFSDPDHYNSAPVFANSTMINAEGEGRVLYIAPGALVSFEHIAFVNGDAPGADGGAIYNAGDASFWQTNICASEAANGGGYYAAAGSDTYFTGAYTGGDARSWCRVATKIELAGAFASITYARFGPNRASADGGGMYFDSGAASMRIRNHGLISNTAGVNGGGVYDASGGRIVNGIFWHNTAQAGDGGGLYSTGGTDLYHNTFNANYALNGRGGGVFGANSFVLNSTLLYQNEADPALADNGGGAYAANGVANGYNNFYANSPGAANFTPDIATSISEDPLLNGIFTLSIQSPNIDAADDTLWTSGTPGGLIIDFDANNQHRPDGHPTYDLDDEQFNPELYGYDSDIGADEYWKDFNCAVEPPAQDATVTPGDTITYTFSILNPGYPYPPPEFAPVHGYTDTISITLVGQSYDWGTFSGGQVDTVELGWGDSVTRVLTVTVPTTATVGQQHVASVRCTSLSYTARDDSATATTSVGTISGILIAPDYITTAVPGDVLTFTHTITNIGNETDEFELTASSGPGNYVVAALVDAAGNVLTPTVELAPQQALTLTLRVEVLETATAGEVAQPGVVGRSTTTGLEGAVINQITIQSTTGTRYVAAGGEDTTNCTDPQQPCATIQHAIDQAVEGDTILVAAGTYTAGAADWDEVIAIDKSLTILGGYTSVDEFTSVAPITNAVRLDAQQARRGVWIDAGLEVTLGGLFIENGQAAATPDVAFGGGIYNAGANLTLTGTWLLDNSAQYGAGLYHGGGTLDVSNSVFARNQNVPNPGSEPGEGGGLYVAGGDVTLHNNTFADNVANGNAGRASATGYGGGLYQNDGTLALLNTIFARNAGTVGSALYLSSTTVLTNNHNLYFANSGTPVVAGVTLTGTAIYTGDPAFIGGEYYRISDNSEAKDKGTPQVPLSVDFELETRPQGLGYDIGADEVTQVAAATFVPVSQTAVIPPNTTYTFTHVLTNSGDYVDTYSLDWSLNSMPTASWGLTLSPTAGISFTLSEGEATTVTLVVTAPAEPGYRLGAVITATGESGVVRSVRDLAIVEFTPGVSIGPNEQGEASAGTTITYTHTLTNEGNGHDRFTLAVVENPLGWPVSVVPSLTGIVEPEGGQTTFAVAVTVPPGTPLDTVHTVVVEANTTNPEVAVSDRLTDTTTVVAPAAADVEIDNGYTQTSAPGGTVLFDHVITNTGDVSGTFVVTATDSESWIVGVDQGPFSLDVNETATVQVTASVPGTAAGVSDYIDVRVSLLGNPAINDVADDTILVSDPSATPGVTVEPDNAGEGAPGQTVVYAHTVTNTGEAGDQFALSATPSQAGWSSTVSPQQTDVLDPGASQAVTVTVAIPAGATDGITDTTTVTATSILSPTVRDQATDTTTVVAQVDTYGVTIAPTLQTQSTSSGGTVVYTHTVTNTGTLSDSYQVSVSFAGGDWGTISGDIADLAPGASTLVTLTIDVPAGTLSGTVNIATITVESVNGDATAEATDVTLVGESPPETAEIEISAGYTITDVAGATVRYNHTITNNGTLADVITLDTDGFWPSGVAPDYLVLDVGQSDSVAVTVTIPADATVGRENLTTLVARSTLSPTVTASVDDTTVVTAPVGGPAPLYLPIIYKAISDGPPPPPPPDLGVDLRWSWAGRGLAGTAVTYYHIMENTGADTDTYTLSAATDLGWNTAVSPLSVQLAAGQRREIMVTVTINGTASTGQVAETTVVARSQTDATVWERQIDRTTVCAASGIDLVVTGIELTPANPTAGEAVTVAVTVENQGSQDVPYGNNFFLDFYVDEAPRLLTPGDYYWGVQGVIMEAGSSHTFSTQYTFSAGTHPLWAQVDTDDTVPASDTACEDDENNIFDGGSVAVTGTAREQETGPLVPPSGSRATPTPLPTPTLEVTPPPTIEVTPLPKPPGELPSPPGVVTGTLPIAPLPDS